MRLIVLTFLLVLSGCAEPEMAANIQLEQMQYCRANGFTDVKVRVVNHKVRSITCSGPWLKP